MSRQAAPVDRVACARCLRPFRPLQHVVILQLGDRNVVAHPGRRCYSPREDTLIQAAQTVEDGTAVWPVDR